MDRRCFFGIYFHTITVEFPLIYRFVSLKSLLEERKERVFCDLKQISRSTSNGQAQHVIDNGLVRIQQEALLKDSSQSSDVESTISRLSKALLNLPNTSFPISKLNDEIFQAHFERISDYLVAGEWCSVEGDRIVFFDGPTEQNSRKSGPGMSHFRDTLVVDVIAKLKHSWCMLLECPTKIPLPKIRVYDDAGQFTKCLHNPNLQNPQPEPEAVVEAPISLSASSFSHQVVDVEQDMPLDISTNDSDEEVEVEQDMPLDISTNDSDKEVAPEVIEMLFQDDDDEFEEDLSDANVAAPPVTPQRDLVILQQVTPKNSNCVAYESSLCRTLSRILDNCPNLLLLDRLRVKMRSSPTQNTQEDYADQEAIIQQQVLCRLKVVKGSLHEWEKCFLVEHFMEPSVDDYDEEAKELIFIRDQCKKLLRGWNIKFY